MCFPIIDSPLVTKQIKELAATGFTRALLHWHQEEKQIATKVNPIFFMIGMEKLLKKTENNVYCKDKEITIKAPTNIGNLNEEE